ncbi:msp domain protein [Lasius niger]|uniref:Msp domain protein n=1 Tax=Lasius niger TaxID=67767 RepID=A0A0J7KJR4_LASNI|nr:msp domain protein [Lasius niger]
MWSFQIKILFRAKELMDIVDGTELLEEQGGDESKIKKWKSRDSRAQHYIVTIVDKYVVPHILICTTSREIFDALKNIYQKDGGQQKCLLL